MFNLWRKRHRKTGRQADETLMNPEMGIQTAPCTKDTIKLMVSGDGEEIKLPPVNENKSEEPFPDTLPSQPAKETDRDERKLSASSSCSISDDTAELWRKKRHSSSGSSGKWANLPRESGKQSTVPFGKSNEADDQDGFPWVLRTGSENGESLSVPVHAEEAPVPHSLVWCSIPEEANTSDHVSSPDTDDCDTDSTSDKAVRNGQAKVNSIQGLSDTFPGLRKDSIDMYKRRNGHIQCPARVQPSPDVSTEEKRVGETDKSCPPGSPPPPGTNQPSPSILKRRSSGLVIDKEVRQSVFTILSGMYAMFLTILGAVLPIAEVFADQKHPLLFEVFYIYMYGGSILFLGYVYTYLLRTRAAQKTVLPLQKKKRRKRRVSVDKIGSHTGSFYLRLGAVAFGIGSMIHSGLQFGDYFEVEAWDPCGHAVFALRPVVHLIFTFVQLYFVFMNSKMCINRYKVIARFGLMHMVATNMCVWFNTIVEETLHQLRLQETPYHAPISDVQTHGHQRLTPNHTSGADVWRNASGPGTDHGAQRVHETVGPLLTTTLGHILGAHAHNHNVTHGLPLPLATPALSVTCQTSELMMTVLETVGPYLYPCSIEYSLICAGIIYTLWKNIGKRVMSIKCDDDSEERAQAHRLRVDCSKSSRGLFMGILILVGTIITMVIFFVLVKTPAFNESAMLVEYLSEISLFTLSSIAVIIAALRMRYLRFNSARDTDFEEVLILISLSGDYMFQMLSLVAAIFDGQQFASRLSISACLLGITQSTLQTMFVLDALRRSSRTPEQGRQKNGRELVTFLLITNIAMWCINTFEAERTVANPVQMHYYGALAWSILTHISIPLGIFFRFHSTVCLSNIWKRAWKTYP